MNSLQPFCHVRPIITLHEKKKTSMAACPTSKYIWQGRRWQNLYLKSYLLGQTNSTNEKRDPPRDHVVSLQNSTSTSPSPRSPLEEPLTRTPLFHYKAAPRNVFFCYIWSSIWTLHATPFVLECTLSRASWFLSFLEKVKCAQLISSLMWHYFCLRKTPMCFAIVILVAYLQILTPLTL